MFVDIPRAKMLQARRCSRKNNRKSDFCEGNIIVSARLTWDSDVVHPKTPTVPLHHRSHVSAISHHKLGNFFYGSSLAVKCAADVPRSFARSDAHKNDVGKAGPRAHQIPRIENSEWIPALIEIGINRPCPQISSNNKLKIGRAACRESCGQYVSHTVVAVSLK